MEKEELIEFIKRIGFKKTWQTNCSYSLTSDLLEHKNYCSTLPFLDAINVSIKDDDIVLTKNQFSVSSMIVTENLGNFSLKDFNRVEFIDKIATSYEVLPNWIKTPLRDYKLGDLF